MMVAIPRILAITGAIAIGSAAPAAAQPSQSSGGQTDQRAMQSQSERATTGQSSAQQVSQQEMQRYVRALMGLASFDPDFAVVVRRGQAAEVTLVDRGLTSAEARQALQQAGMTPQEFRRITAAIHQDEQLQQRYQQVVQQQVAQAEQQGRTAQQQPRTGQDYGASGGGAGLESGQQTQQGMASGGVTDQQLQQYVETRRTIEQQMGWSEFVRVHNRIAGDQALQARLQQQMRRTQSGAPGRATEPPYRAGPPPRPSAPGEAMPQQPGAGGQQSGTSGQPVSPGEGAPLPSGGALGVGPETVSPEEQQPPGTREPSLGTTAPRPSQ